MADHDQFADDLVLLALNELPETRAVEVRDHVAGCAACRREFDALRADTALLALSATGSHPPQRSRESLLSAIAKEPRVTRMVQVRPRWWALAPVFAAAVVTVFAILLWAENNDLRNELSALQSQVADTRQDLGHSREILAAMTAPDAMHLTLVATQAKPQPQIRVIYLKRSGNLMYFASNLAPLPEHKAYEMWIIPANGKAPIAAGTFKPDAHGMAQVLSPSLSDAPDAKTFAVTIENEAGSPVPTSPVIMGGQ